MTSEKELQLVVAAVECADPVLRGNKLRKIRIYQRDVLKFKPPSKLKEGGGSDQMGDDSSFYKAFTEFAVRAVILEQIGVDTKRDADGDKHSNDGRRIQRAKVELYDPHSCKFVVITESSSDPVVDRFGTRVRCNVSDIIWSSSLVEREENEVTNPLGEA